MNVDSLIERNRFARFASLVTLASCKITNGVQLLISGRTVNRIDLDPTIGVQRATGSNVSFDTSQKSGDCVLSFVVPTTSPITTTFLRVVTLGMIQKRMSVSPTMTGGVLGHYVKRTTHDNRTVFVTTQINQIVAIRKRKGHLSSPVWWGAAPLRSYLWGQSPYTSTPPREIIFHHP